MGKLRDQAMSVPWEEIQAAIQMNPQRGAVLTRGAASMSVAVMPVTETALPWLPGWTEDTTFTISDVVSFVLWIRDPLYRSAGPAVRSAMEREEALALLHASETAWKEHGGRVRGWIRKHLEEELRGRAGGDDAPSNFWDSVRTTKRVAQLVDYVCVTRGIRIAVWWPEQGTMTMFPHGSGYSPVIHQLNASTGRVMMELGDRGRTQIPIEEWTGLALRGKDIEWSPPASAPSSGALTVAQIQERLREYVPDAPLGGGRTSLWNRVQWQYLCRAMSVTDAVRMGTTVE